MTDRLIVDGQPAKRIATINLPLPVTAVVGMLKGLTEEYPDARVVPDGDRFHVVVAEE